MEQWFRAEIKEAKQMNAGSKPGYKTTEFYFNLATQMGVLWAAIHGFVPAPWNVIIPMAGTAIYTIAATVRKAIADISAAKIAAATATSTAV